VLIVLRLRDQGTSSLIPKASNEAVTSRVSDERNLLHSGLSSRFSHSSASPLATISSTSTIPSRTS
jgi:hypothetical protein